jgi:hypothetical protein
MITSIIQKEKKLETRAKYIIMHTYPSNWSVQEEYDGNYIFINDEKSFCVNLDYTPACEYPYSITFVQIKGEINRIGFEDGRYSTHSKILLDAFDKVSQMMNFINSKL